MTPIARPLAAWLGLSACASPGAPPEGVGGPDLARDRPAVGILEEVAVGARSAVAVRDGERWEILAREAGAERVLVPTGGDRLALSPDGETLAFVAPRDGLAAVWVVPFGGGEARAVTPPARPTGGRGLPDGYLPPPRDRSLRFEGDRLCWSAPGGGAPTCVDWR